MQAATQKQNSFEPLRHDYTENKSRALQSLNADTVHEVIHSLSDYADAALIEVTQKTLEKHPSASLSLIATGGYGRRQLSTASDIDLLILIAPNKADEEATKALVHNLWDCHMPLSHAVRTFDDTLAQAKEDQTIFTSLLDARLVHGSTETFDALIEAHRSLLETQREQFIQDKLEETKDRHIKIVDLPFFSVKSSLGGLRDIHTVGWLQQAAKTPALSEEEQSTLNQLFTDLWHMRLKLHEEAGSPSDLLTPDVSDFLDEAEITRIQKASQELFTSVIAPFFKKHA